jgi:hypothetical protein
LMQGVTALSAGFLGTEADRREIHIVEFLLLQLRSFELTERSTTPPDGARAPRDGLSRQELGRQHDGERDAE